jgi:hypothetical protein
VVATNICRSLSFCCLLFSCDPCPPKMTLTSLSTRGKAPSPPPPVVGVVAVLVLAAAEEEVEAGKVGRAQQSA